MYFHPKTSLGGRLAGKSPDSRSLQNSFVRDGRRASGGGDRAECDDLPGGDCLVHDVLQGTAGDGTLEEPQEVPVGDRPTPLPDGPHDPVMEALGVVLGHV